MSARQSLILARLNFDIRLLVKCAAASLRFTTILSLLSHPLPLLHTFILSLLHVLFFRFVSVFSSSCRTLDFFSWSFSPHSGKQSDESVFSSCVTNEGRRFKETRYKRHETRGREKCVRDEERKKKREKKETRKVGIEEGQKLVIEEPDIQDP